MSSPHLVDGGARLIVSVGGRRFRQFSSSLTPPASATRSARKRPADNVASQSGYGDPEAIESFTALTDPKTGELVFRMDIGRAFHGFVIGQGGKNLAQLQKDTGARITLPGKNSKSETVEIRAKSQAAIASAKTRLELIVEQKASSLPPTHFISVPLVAPQFKAAYSELVKQIHPSMDPTKGLHPSLLVSPEKLHLTLFVLRLHSAGQVQRAVQVMKDSAADVYDLVGTTSVLLTVGGLDVMNDDPAHAHVLHLRVADDAHLAKIRKAADALVRAFAAAGLLGEEEQESQQLYSLDPADPSSRRLDLKFHATVLNTKYRSDQPNAAISALLPAGPPDGFTDSESPESSTVAPELKGDGSSPRRRRRSWTKRQSMDASDILKRLGSASLGRERVPALHLSEMSTVGPDGYYRCLHKIDLP